MKKLMYGLMALLMAVALFAGGTLLSSISYANEMILAHCALVEIDFQDEAHKERVLEFLKGVEGKIEPYSILQIHIYPKQGEAIGQRDVDDVVAIFNALKDALEPIPELVIKAEYPVIEIKNATRYPFYTTTQFQQVGGKANISVYTK